MINVDVGEEIDVSVVSPVFGCADCLPELVEEISEAFDGYQYIEIILVCDRSPDRSWQVIRELADRDSRIVGLLLAKNVGQHHAVTAGLDSASGRISVVLDCDLQADPQDAVTLVKVIEGGEHIAIAESASTGQSSKRRIGERWLYYRLINLLDVSSSPQRHGTHSFFALSETARRAVCSYRERLRQLSVILRDVGFDPVYVPIKLRPRRDGPSSYSTRDRLNLAFEGLLLYSSRVLKDLIPVSFVLFFATVIIAAVFMTRYLWGGPSLPGWFSTVQLLLFVSSLQLLSLGVTGLYLHSVLVELRRRPGYVIAETTRVEHQP